MFKHLRMMLLGTIILLAAVLPTSMAEAAHQQQIALPDAMLADLADDGTAEVIVSFAIDFNVTRLTTTDIGVLEQSVKAGYNNLIRAMGSSSQPLNVVAYSHVPAAYMIVDEAALAALQTNPYVTAVEANVEAQPALAEVVPLIWADVAHAAGLTGDGVRIAIADTGLDFNHPAFAGVTIVDQYCDDTNDPIGYCQQDPNNPAMDFNGHGTMVASVIASNGSGAVPVGVAPDAELLIGRLGENGLGSIADLLGYLDHLIGNHDILLTDIVNMSFVFGGAGIYEDAQACTAARPALHTAAQLLAELDVTLFASAGNSGIMDGLLVPACLPDVISVSGTWDADIDANVQNSIVQGFNRHATLDLLAPGCHITVAEANGGAGSLCGTSGAAPAAAATAALFIELSRELNDEPSPQEIRTQLIATGLQVPDPSLQLHFPRVDAAAALGLQPVQPQIPMPPAALKAVLITATSADLRWIDSSDSETEYRVYREGTLIATLPADTTTYTDTGLNPHTIYEYHVTWFDGTSESFPSNFYQVGTTNQPDEVIRTLYNENRQNQSAMVLNRRGNPVVSYYDETDGGLKLMWCNDPTCSDTVIRNITNPAGHVVWNDIALNAKDYPVISYYDYDLGQINIIVCEVPTCGTYTPTTILTGIYSPAIGPSVAVTSDNKPMVAFYDPASTDFVLGISDDPLCATVSLATVSSPDDVGIYPSLALTSQNLPVLSYYDRTNQQILLTFCHELTCSQHTTRTIASVNDDPSFSSVVLDANDVPYVAYGTPDDLMLATCQGIDCQVVTPVTLTPTLPPTGFSVGDVSAALDANGHPVVVYHHSGNLETSIRMARCQDSVCSTFSTVVIDSMRDTGWWPTVAIDGNNNPVVAYTDESEDDIKLFRTTWPFDIRSEEQILLPPEPNSYGNFGAHIVLEDDILVVHTREPSDRLYVYDWDGTQWVLETQIDPPPNTPTMQIMDFGEALAISNGILVVGAQRSTSGL
ncbi:MAG: S8 family serine peptidase [Anaerolineae bacterium]